MLVLLNSVTKTVSIPSNLLVLQKNHKPSTPDFSFLLDCHGEPGLSLVSLMFEQFHFVDFLIKFDEVD